MEMHCSRPEVSHWESRCLQVGDSTDAQAFQLETSTYLKVRKRWRGPYICCSYWSQSKRGVARRHMLKVSLNIFRISFLRKSRKIICGEKKRFHFAGLCFRLWSVSSSTTHLLYLGCPVRLIAETHWKRQIHAFTKGPVFVLLHQSSQSSQN